MKEKQVSRGVKLLLAAWTVFVLVGCGGGGGGGAAPTAPATPSGLSAAAVSTTEVHLAWTDNSSDETGFKIERSADNVTFTPLETTAANVTSYSDTGHTAATTYYYRVAATNSAGDSAYSNTAHATTLVEFSNFQSASVEIGWPAFTSPLLGQPVAADTLNNWSGAPVVVNGKLYLPDSGNNRVLGYDSIPTTNGASADFVLGQADMTSAGSGSAADALGNPESVKSDGTRLFVADSANSRILVWNTVPTTTQVPADLVIGQPDFGSVASACTATGLNWPEDMIIVNNKLIVPDNGNHRVLIWNSIPTASGAAADIVLGQGDFTHCQSNDDNQDGTIDGAPTARTFDTPAGVWSDGTRLVIADSWNNRVLIWNSLPAANFAPADVVLGQADFTHNTPNDDDQNGVDDGAPTARTLKAPYFVDSNGTQLVLSDYLNNRVLIWNTFPTSNFAPAERVLGQDDFTHNMSNDDDQNGVDDGAQTARTLNSPMGVYLYGTKLFITDSNNHRLLIFESQ